ncbi:MAG: DUF4118 domain-containing protein [Sphingomonas adhaesiva]|uniref:sensor histidine kinase n=1 Tax=Sphingomonas adhaesiva TaxID=28212 RepID=UPI002FFBA3DA
MADDTASALPDWFPRGVPSLAVSVAGTVAIVASATLLRYALGQPLQSFPTLLFSPAVFLAALLFDRRCGLLAIVLSTASSAYFFVYPYNSLTLPLASLVPLCIFVLTSSFVVTVTDTLRQVAARLDRAERNKSLLLDELAHRTKNDLAIVGSALQLQARSSDDPAVQEALATAVARVNVIAAAQDRLRYREGIGQVDIADYLLGLCTGLGDLLRGVRPIAVRLEAPTMTVSGADAVTIGLIVNELVTNAFKYAFQDNGGGAVDVKIEREGGNLRIHVRDDGIGCADDAVSGMGSRLVRLLAQQRGGVVSRVATETGCHVTATLALEEMPDVRVRP